jgi:hypothetical protein
MDTSGFRKLFCDYTSGFVNPFHQKVEPEKTDGFHENQHNFIVFIEAVLKEILNISEISTK